MKLTKMIMTVGLILFSLSAAGSVRAEMKADAFALTPFIQPTPFGEACQGGDGLLSEKGAHARKAFCCGLRSIETHRYE